MLPVRKKRGPAVADLTRCNLRQLFRSTAAGRYSEESAPEESIEDDRIAAPRASTVRRRVGNDLRRPTVDADGLELSVRDKADRATVGRPEWIRCTLSTGES